MSVPLLQTPGQSTIQLEGEDDTRVVPKEKANETPEHKLNIFGSAVPINVFDSSACPRSVRRRATCYVLRRFFQRHKAP